MKPLNPTQDQLKQLSEPCDECGGSGYSGKYHIRYPDVHENCPTCQGTGHKTVTFEFEMDQPHYGQCEVIEITDKDVTFQDTYEPNNPNAIGAFKECTTIPLPIQVGEKRWVRMKPAPDIERMTVECVGVEVKLTASDNTWVKFITEIPQYKFITQAKMRRT